MGKEEIQIFHEQLEKILLPFLQGFDFHLDNKRIDESIGSYGVVFKRNDKCISLSFCMHHYDLFDGIKVNLYYENYQDNRLTLNSMGKEEYKIYSQLRPENSLVEIQNDLKTFSEDFIIKD